MLKVFIIEDDANVLFGLQAQLSLRGFNVITENGNESVEAILNKIRIVMPDFVILDLILPKFDGFEILKLIKMDKEICNIPVFAFTNLSDDDSRNRGMDLGIEFYLLKNEISIDEAVDKFTKIVKNKLK